jgi:hypothetical protein
MEVIREKEKIYIIAKDESEAKRTELLINPLLKQISGKNLQTSGKNDFQRFKELTKDFKEAQQSDIDSLSEEVDKALLQDYLKKNAS